MDDSPLQYLDYDVTRYLYETYFPTQKTRFNYNNVIQQFKRLIKGYCIVDHYITDSNGYKYRTCKIHKGYTEKSFIRYIKINK